MSMELNINSFLTAVGIRGNYFIIPQLSVCTCKGSFEFSTTSFC